MITNFENNNQKVAQFNSRINNEIKPLESIYTEMKNDNYSEKNNDIQEYSIDELSSPIISFGKNGEKVSEYTIDNGVETGINYTGEAGKEVITGKWRIEYAPDGLNYLNQTLYDASGNVIRRIDYR